MDHHSHTHSHSHSHGQVEGDSHSHSHSHGQEGSHHHSHSPNKSGKWEADWESLDDNKDWQASSALVAGKLTSSAWWKPDLYMLDYGCGTGLMLRLLCRNNPAFKAVGADVEPGMLKVFCDKIELEKLEDRLELLELKNNGIKELPLEQFDVAVSSFVFGHIAEPQVDEVLRGLVDSVKPGGRIMITEIVSAGALHGKEEKFVSEGGRAHTNFDKGCFEAKLSALGLKVDSTEYSPVPAVHLGAEAQHIYAQKL